MYALRLIALAYITSTRTVSRYAGLSARSTIAAPHFFSQLDALDYRMVDLLHAYASSVLHQSPMEWLRARLAQRNIPPNAQESVIGTARQLMDIMGRNLVKLVRERHSVRDLAVAPLSQEARTSMDAFDAELRHIAEQLTDVLAGAALSGPSLGEHVRQLVRTHGRSATLSEDLQQLLVEMLTTYTNAIIHPTAPTSSVDLLTHSMQQCSNDLAGLILRELHGLQSEGLSERVRQAVEAMPAVFGIAESQEDRAVAVVRAASQMQSDLRYLNLHLDRFVLRNWMTAAAPGSSARLADQALLRTADRAALLASIPVRQVVRTKPLWDALLAGRLASWRDPVVRAAEDLDKVARQWLPYANAHIHPELRIPYPHELALVLHGWSRVFDKRGYLLEGPSELMAMVRSAREVEFLRSHREVLLPFVEEALRRREQLELAQLGVADSVAGGAVLSREEHGALLDAWQRVREALQPAGASLYHLRIPGLSDPPSDPIRAETILKAADAIHQLLDPANATVEGLIELGRRTERTLRQYYGSLRYQGDPTAKQIFRTIESLSHASPTEVPRVLERYQQVIETARQQAASMRPLTTPLIWAADPFAPFKSVDHVLPTEGVPEVYSFHFDDPSDPLGIAGEVRHLAEWANCNIQTDITIHSFQMKLSELPEDVQKVIHMQMEWEIDFLVAKEARRRAEMSGLEVTPELLKRLEAEVRRERQRLLREEIRQEVRRRLRAEPHLREDIRGLVREVREEVMFWSNPLFHRAWYIEGGNRATHFYYGPEHGFFRKVWVLEEGLDDVDPQDVLEHKLLSEQPSSVMRGRLIRRRRGGIDTITVLGEWQYGPIGQPPTDPRIVVTEEREVLRGLELSRVYDRVMPFQHSLAVRVEEVAGDFRIVPIIGEELQRMRAQLEQQVQEAAAGMDEHLRSAITAQQPLLDEAIEVTERLAQKLQLLMRGEFGGVLSRRRIEGQEVEHLRALMERLAFLVGNLPQSRRLRRLLHTTPRPGAMSARFTDQRFVDLPVAPGSLYVQRGEVTLEVIRVGVEERAYADLMELARRGGVLEINEPMFHRLVREGLVRDVTGVPVGMSEGDLQVLRTVTVEDMPRGLDVDYLVSESRRRRRFVREPYKVGSKGARSRAADQTAGVQSAAVPAAQAGEVVEAAEGRATGMDVVRVLMAQAEETRRATQALAEGRAYEPASLRRVIANAGVEAESSFELLLRETTRAVSFVTQALRESEQGDIAYDIIQQLMQNVVGQYLGEAARAGSVSQLESAYGTLIQAIEPLMKVGPITPALNRAIRNVLRQYDKEWVNQPGDVAWNVWWELQEMQRAQAEREARSESVTGTVSLEELAKPRGDEPEGMEVDTALARAAPEAGRTESAAVTAEQRYRERLEGVRHRGEQVARWFLDPEKPLPTLKWSRRSAGLDTRLIERYQRLVDLGLAARSSKEEVVRGFAQALSEDLYAIAGRVTDDLIVRRAGGRQFVSRYLEQLAEQARLRPQLVKSRLQAMVLYDLVHQIETAESVDDLPVWTENTLRWASRLLGVEEGQLAPQKYRVGTLMLKSAYVQGLEQALPGPPSAKGNIASAIADYAEAREAGELELMQGREVLPLTMHVPGAGVVETYLTELQVGGNMVHALWLNGQWVPILPERFEVRSYLSEVRVVPPPDRTVSQIRTAAIQTLGGAAQEESLAITPEGRVVVQPPQASRPEQVFERLRRETMLALDLETTLGAQTPVAFGLVAMDPAGKARRLMHRVVVGPDPMEQRAAAAIQKGVEIAQQLAETEAARFYPSGALQMEISQFQQHETVKAEIARLESIQQLLDILEQEQYRSQMILVENKAFDISSLIGYLERMRNNPQVVTGYRGGASAIEQLERRVRALYPRIVDPQEVLAATGYRRREGVSRSLSVEARLRQFLQSAGVDTSAIEQVETHVSAMDAFHSALTLRSQLRSLNRSAEMVSRVSRGTLLYGVSSYPVPGMVALWETPYMRNNINTPAGRLFRVVQLERAGAESAAPGMRIITLEELTGTGRRWRIQVSSPSMLEDIFNVHFMVVDPAVMRARGVPVQTQEEAEAVARRWSAHVLHDRALRKLRAALGIGTQAERGFLEDVEADRSVRSELFQSIRTLRRGLGMTGERYMARIERMLQAESTEQLLERMPAAMEAFVRTAVGDDEQARRRALEVLQGEDTRLLLLDVLRGGDLPHRETLHPLLYEFLLDVQYAQRYLTDPLVRRQYEIVGERLAHPGLQPVIQQYQRLAAEAVGVGETSRRPQHLLQAWTALGAGLSERYAQISGLERTIPPLEIPPHDVGITIRALGRVEGTTYPRLISLVDPQAARATIEQVAMTEMQRMGREELQDLLRSAGIAGAESIARSISEGVTGRPSVLQPEMPWFQKAVAAVFEQRLTPRSIGQSISLDEMLQLVERIRAARMGQGTIQGALESATWMPEAARKSILQQLTQGLTIRDEMAVTPEVTPEMVREWDVPADPRERWALEEAKRLRRLMFLDFDQEQLDTEELVRFFGRQDEVGLATWASRLSEPGSMLYSSAEEHRRRMDALKSLLGGEWEEGQIMERVRSQAYRLSMFMRTGFALQPDLPSPGWQEAEPVQIVDEMIHQARGRMGASPQAMVPLVGLTLAGIAGAVLYGVMDESRRREERERRGAQIEKRGGRAVSTEHRDREDDDDVEYTIRGGKLSEASVDRIRTVVAAGHNRRARSHGAVYRRHRFLRTDVRNMAERLIGVD